MLADLYRKHIEDSFLARLVAEHIDEGSRFKHYATIKLDDQSGVDDIGYRWRTIHIGLNHSGLYVAERSDTAEGVSIANVEKEQDVLDEIASRARHQWTNSRVDVGPALEESLEHGTEIPNALA